MLLVCKDLHQQNCSHTTVVAVLVVCHCAVSYSTIMAQGLNLLVSIAIGELHTYCTYTYIYIKVIVLFIL